MKQLITNLKYFNMKGSFNEIKGDLLSLFREGKFDLIVHGANCFNTMGAGIAYQIATQFPEAEQADKDFLIPVGDINRLGTFSMVQLDKGLILNAYTQFKPGRNLSAEALIINLAKIGQLFKGKHIGLPLIGCGIAGGNWKEVRELIRYYLRDCKVTVVHWTK